MLPQAWVMLLRLLEGTPKSLHPSFREHFGWTLHRDASEDAEALVTSWVEGEDQSSLLRQQQVMMHKWC